MRQKTCLIVVLAACVLCALAFLCGGVGYFALRKLQTTQTGGPTPELALQSDSRGGGTLRIYGDLPPTLDPALVQDSTSAEYVVHLFSGLVSLDSALEIVPDLATRWDVSPDGLRYTFQLDEAATFADGRAISAEDVVYSLTRAGSPETGSTVAASYLNDIVGATAFMRGGAAQIEGLRVVDAHTLEITIDAPKAYFLAKLTYPTAFVVDRAQVEREGNDWWQAPNGSGPFVLQSLSSEGIVLARNERYYGRRPALAKAEFLASSGLPISMYENNELDIVGVGAGEIERVLDPDNPLYAEHHSAPELSVQYLGLNVNRPPFDDPLVRQAFALAIDTNKIAELVYKNTAIAARGIMPPGLLPAGAQAAALGYNPSKARALLAQSRYGAAGAMPAVVLTTSGTSGHMPPLEQAILSMIEENLGIALTVEQVEWADFLRDMNRQRYQMFTTGWIADYPDPQNFCDLLFHSESAQNHTGYHNAEVDRLLERARVEADPDKRLELYRQAEGRILSDAPWVPLTHGVAVTLVKPYVHGYSASANLYPWLKDISLD